MSYNCIIMKLNTIKKGEIKHCVPLASADGNYGYWTMLNGP